MDEVKATADKRAARLGCAALIIIVLALLAYCSFEGDRDPSVTLQQNGSHLDVEVRDVHYPYGENIAEAIRAVRGRILAREKGINIGLLRTVTFTFKDEFSEPLVTADYDYVVLTGLQPEAPIGQVFDRATTVSVRAPAGEKALESDCKLEGIGLADSKLCAFAEGQPRW